MSGQLYTSREAEERIARIRGAIGVSVVEKWHVLRLGLAASLRRGSKVARPGLDGALKAKEPYRLSVVTGQSKKLGDVDPDLTLTLRTMLATLQDDDLFDPVEGEARFIGWLEAHIERGLRELDHRLLSESLWSILEPWTDPPPAAPKASTERPDGLRDVLQRHGVQTVAVSSAKQGPRYDRYRLELRSARDMSALREHKDTIAFELQRLAKDVHIEETLQPGVLHLDLLRPAAQWRPLRLPDLERWARLVVTQEELPVCLGADVEGEPRWIDLSAGHILLGGTTGSGKSSAAHMLLCSLLLRLRPDVVQLGIYDAKEVEGGLYRGLPHLQWPAELITDRGGLLVALRRLQEEMARRVTLFRTHGWRSLKEARARGEALPYIVLFLDELADVSGDAEIGAALEDLARKGRFAGIHLIAATQRPDAATFSGQLRANLSVRIALAVNKAAESRIILDEAGAELLPRPGELLARLQDAGGRGMVRLHGVWLEAEDVRSVVTRRGGGG